MELRTELMRIGGVDRFARWLRTFDEFADDGIFYGVTEDSRAAMRKHVAEPRVWREMVLLYVAPDFQEISAAEQAFTSWAAFCHSERPCARVDSGDVVDGAHRYWLYVLR